IRDTLESFQRMLIWLLRPLAAGRCQRRRLELHGLRLDELLQAELAELAAAARLLEPAEARERVEAAAADVDLARAQAARDAFGPRRVRLLDASREALDGGVRDADGLVLLMGGDVRD